jgi:hypothetical protein
MSEFKNQKIEFELLTVNFEDLTARNAQLTADADQSNNEWNRKEDTYSSQVNNVKLSAQCLIVLHIIFSNPSLIKSLIKIC